MRLARISPWLAAAAFVAACHASPQEVPRWLRGSWTRAWIEEGGSRTSTFDVHYLQTPGLYGDLRIPLDRPAMPLARSFDDLSDDDLKALSRQVGFAGWATVAGDRATWGHLVDFQPMDAEPDVGRLERLGPGRMNEHALDRSYTESWQSRPDGRGRFLALRTETRGRIRRLLLVAGDDFFYVRNRAIDLPRAASLEALLAAPGTTRAQAVAWLDCELSYGKVRGGAVAWQILRSTLPWREGRPLDFVDQLRATTARPGISLRTPGAERLVVSVDTLPRRELQALLPAE